MQSPTVKIVDTDTRTDVIHITREDQLTGTTWRDDHNGWVASVFVVCPDGGREYGWGRGDTGPESLITALYNLAAELAGRL